MSSSGNDDPGTVPVKKNGKKTRLPDNFIPGKYAVICGRGKACTSSTGNRNLKSLILSYLKAYSQARTKVDKSTIVSTIIASVRQAAPDGAFVKLEDGAWWEVEEAFAREKIGCVFRDCLHTQYKSSTKAKLARKKASKEFMSDDSWSLGSSNHSSSSAPPYFPTSDFSGFQATGTRGVMHCPPQRSCETNAMMPPTVFDGGCPSLMARLSLDPIPLPPQPARQGRSGPYPMGPVHGQDTRQDTRLCIPPQRQNNWGNDNRPQAQAMKNESFVVSCTPSSFGQAKVGSHPANPDYTATTAQKQSSHASQVLLNEARQEILARKFLDDFPDDLSELFEDDTSMDPFEEILWSSAQQQQQGDRGFCQ